MLVIKDILPIIYSYTYDVEYKIKLHIEEKLERNFETLIRNPNKKGSKRILNRFRHISNDAYRFYNILLSLSEEDEDIIELISNTNPVWCPDIYRNPNPIAVNYILNQNSCIFRSEIMKNSNDKFVLHFLRTNSICIDNIIHFALNKHPLIHKAVIQILEDYRIWYEIFKKNTIGWHMNPDERRVLAGVELTIYHLTFHNSEEIYLYLTKYWEPFLLTMRWQTLAADSIFVPWIAENFDDILHKIDFVIIPNDFFVKLLIENYTYLTERTRFSSNSSDLAVDYLLKNPSIIHPRYICNNKNIRVFDFLMEYHPNEIQWNYLLSNPGIFEVDYVETRRKTMEWVEIISKDN